MVFSLPLKAVKQVFGFWRFTRGLAGSLIVSIPSDDSESESRFAGEPEESFFLTKNPIVFFFEVVMRRCGFMCFKDFRGEQLEERQLSSR